MLLALQIILTILAWRKGWRWKALIPVAIAIGLAFFGGVVIASSGGTPDNKGGFILVDIFLIITQAILATKAPGQKRAASTEVMSGSLEEV